MIHRRSFMNISLTVIPGIIFSDGRVFDDKRKLKYKLSLETPTKYFNGEQCFVHPRAGIIPGWGAGGRPRVVFLMNTQELSGSDVYKSELGFFTDNLGETWSKPQAIETLQPR